MQDTIQIDVLETLQAMRQKCPLVHCITNLVVMQVNANVLLAAGASPIMAHAQEELEDLVKIINALVLNIGTLDKLMIASMNVAGDFANKYKKPVVLDPVGAGASRLRTETALSILRTIKPCIVRGNGSEIMALAGEIGETKGVDSTKGSLEVTEQAKHLAKTFQTVVSVSGKVDMITDGSHVAYVYGGNPLMTLVTGIGCSATAMTGACMAVAKTPFIGAVSAMALFASAGEKAGKKCQGPGSFLSYFIDELYNADYADAAKRVTLG